jgi:hypothetical protein
MASRLTLSLGVFFDRTAPVLHGRRRELRRLMKEGRQERKGILGVLIREGDLVGGRTAHPPLTLLANHASQSSVLSAATSLPLFHAPLASISSKLPVRVSFFSITKATFLTIFGTVGSPVLRP